jgi:hypothetical protein
MTQSLASMLEAVVSATEWPDDEWYLAELPSEGQIIPDEITRRACARQWWWCDDAEIYWRDLRQ